MYSLGLLLDEHYKLDSSLRLEMFILSTIIVHVGFYLILLHLR